MATKKILLPRRSEIQIYYPKISKNGFGYCLALATVFTIGRYAFAVEILGFGIGFCYDVPWVLYKIPPEAKEGAE